MKSKPHFFDGWLLVLVASVGISGLSAILIYSVANIRENLFTVAIVVLIVSFLVAMTVLEFGVKQKTKRIFEITRKRKKTSNGLCFDKPSGSRD